jgi:hypothetical protein
MTHNLNSPSKFDTVKSSPVSGEELRFRQFFPGNGRPGCGPCKRPQFEPVLYVFLRRVRREAPSGLGIENPSPGGARELGDIAAQPLLEARRSYVSRCGRKKAKGSEV